MTSVAQIEKNIATVNRIAGGPLDMNQGIQCVWSQLAKTVKEAVEDKLDDMYEKFQ